MTPVNVNPYFQGIIILNKETDSNQEKSSIDHLELFFISFQEHSSYSREEIFCYMQFPLLSHSSPPTFCFQQIGTNTNISNDQQLHTAPLLASLQLFS